MDFIVPGYSIKDLYKILSCLLKFGESLSITGNSDQILFSLMDSSRSSYARFLFSLGFFDELKILNTSDVEVNCKVDLKIIIDILRVSLVNSVKTERIEVTINDSRTEADSLALRMNMKLIYPNLVYQKIQLSYQNSSMDRLTITKDPNCFHWRINSKFLLTLNSQFDIRVDEFTIICTPGSIILQSFHNEIMNAISNQARVKRQAHTSLIINPSDLDNYHVGENVSLTLSVKEFRAIINLAKEMESSIDVYFTKGGAPMFFEINLRGTIFGQFVLCTTEEATLNLTQTAQDMESSFIISQHIVEPNRNNTQKSIDPIRRTRTVHEVDYQNKDILTELSQPNIGEPVFNQLSSQPMMEHDPSLDLSLGLSQLLLRSQTVPEISKRVATSTNSSIKNKRIEKSKSHLNERSNNNVTLLNEPQLAWKPYGNNYAGRIEEDDVDDPDFIPATP